MAASFWAFALSISYLTNRITKKYTGHTGKPKGEGKTWPQPGRRKFIKTTTIVFKRFLGIWKVLNMDRCLLWSMTRKSPKSKERRKNGFRSSPSKNSHPFAQLRPRRSRDSLATTNEEGIHPLSLGHFHPFLRVFCGMDGPSFFLHKTFASTFRLDAGVIAFAIVYG